MLPEMIGLIRPLRIGWMNHRDIGVARGIEPVSDADIAAVTTKRKKKRFQSIHSATSTTFAFPSKTLP